MSARHKNRRLLATAFGGLALLVSADRLSVGEAAAQSPTPARQVASAATRPMKLGVTFTSQSMLGALVMDVYPGSPAAKVGLQPGDRILEANGRAISGSSDAVQLIDQLAPGSNLHMLIAREGRRRVLETTLTPWKAPAMTTGVSAPAPASMYAPFPQGFPFQLTPADIDDQHAYGG
jgi:predicted metalloprotease with PDZ domain